MLEFEDLEWTLHVPLNWRGAAKLKLSRKFRKRACDFFGGFALSSYKTSVTFYAPLGIRIHTHYPAAVYTDHH
jgi:hypothetical protein